jgi:hypothetical protein
MYQNNSASKSMPRAFKIGFAVLVYIVAISVLCQVAGAFAYAPFLDFVDDDPGPENFLNPDAYYQFDPKTLIFSLSEGKEDVFTKLREAPDEHWPTDSNPVYWNQTEFLTVAAAIVKTAGYDQISEWSLYRADFDRGCDVRSTGFYKVTLYIFKPTWLEGQLWYEVRQIVIASTTGLIQWTENRHFPRPLFGWKGIKLDASELTVEEAISTTDKMGGEVWRLAEPKDCSITAFRWADEWNVFYWPGDGPYYSIDAYSGKLLKKSD